MMLVVHKPDAENLISAGDAEKFTISAGDAEKFISAGDAWPAVRSLKTLTEIPRVQNRAGTNNV